MGEYQEMELYSWQEQAEGKLHSSNTFIPFPAVASPAVV